MAGLDSGVCGCQLSRASSTRSVYGYWQWHKACVRLLAVCLRLGSIFGDEWVPLVPTMLGLPFATVERSH